MVIKDASSFFALLDDLDSSSSKQLEALETLIKKYPDFHLARMHHLKILQQHNPIAFNKQLPHTAIATYDRELLYEFIENNKITSTAKNTLKEKQIKKVAPEVENYQNEKSDKKVTEERVLFEESEEVIPKKLYFSEWAKYLKTKQVITKENITLEDKFQLIDSFLTTTKRIVPDKNTKNTVDLSEKSLTSTNELMTETLAKVFVKQKRYDKAVQAYQILGLKYPEKNSFFADQIKEIKRLQKLKN